MAKIAIALKVSAKEFGKLVILGNRVVASLTGNASFMTPVPALTVVTSAVNDVVAALALWGPKGNRGSHAVYADLVVKGKTLKNLLSALSSYAMTTGIVLCNNDQAALRAILETTGFPLNLPNAPVGLLQPVQNLRNIKDKSLGANSFRARFKRPLNTNSPKDVSSYLIYRGTTSVFAAATQIATVPSTTFIDTNTTAAPVTYFYWLCPVGTAGVGAVSDVLSVQLGV